MNTELHHARIATSWAAAALSAEGCTLHATKHGWDVETPNGWRVANNWRELCAVAKEVRAAHTVVA
jgi:hypothetical protein